MWFCRIRVWLNGTQDSNQRVYIRVCIRADHSGRRLTKEPQKEYVTHCPWGFYQRQAPFGSGPDLNGAQLGLKIWLILHSTDICWNFQEEVSLPQTTKKKSPNPFSRDFTYVYLSVPVSRLRFCLLFYISSVSLIMTIILVRYGFVAYIFMLL